jgi:hypothetical protein
MRPKPGSARQAPASGAERQDGAQAAVLVLPDRLLGPAAGPFNDWGIRSMSSREEILLDHRARLEHERQQNEERRQYEQAQQTSIRYTPEERIRLWERRHRLSLPRTSDHALLAVIARATALTHADVEHEQQRRAGVASAPVTTAGSL